MYEVVIVDNHSFMRKELYLVQRNHNGVVTHIAEPIEITMKPYKASTEAKPTIIFQDWGGDDVLHAFERAFTKELEPKLGELKATQEHLKDMKTIAFHKLNISAPTGGNDE